VPASLLRIASLGLICAYFEVWTLIGVVYGMDLPFLDQWDTPLGQIIRLFSTGHLGFFDLWSQHNEARKVVPTAISVALATLLGRYDVKVELLVGGVLLGAIVVAIARLARAGGMTRETALCLALLYTALAGSRRTITFHLYSVTFERLIPELAILVSLTLLVVRGPSWGTASASAALLVLGQYSFPGGIVGWLIVPGFAFLAFRQQLPRVVRPLLFVVACGALSSIAYFWRYGHPSGHPPLASAFAEPWTSWAQFILRFLGNPISGTQWVAALVGGLALLTGMVAGWRAVRVTDGVGKRLALASIALATYSITQAILATVGRLSMNLGHALRGDYVVHATYLYLAVAALVILAVPARAQPGLGLGLITISTVLFAILVSHDARQDLRVLRAAKSQARACALADWPDPAVCTPDNPWLNPSPGIVRERAALARAAGAWGDP